MAKTSLKTGRSLPGCYARGLRACGNKLTREHYVSRSVLAQLGNYGILGFPWQKSADLGEAGPGALASKILCDRHNSLLSEVDQALGEVIASLLLFRDPLTVPNDKRIVTVNGHQFERGLVKTLAGTYAAGLARRAEQLPPRNREPPRDWLHILFEGTTLSQPCGFYVYAGLGLEVEKMFGMVPLFDHLPIPRGADFRIAGYHFRLELRNPDRANLTSAAYRPSTIRFIRETTSCELRFEWPDDSTQHQSMTAAWQGQTTGASRHLLASLEVVRRQLEKTPSKR